MRPPIAFEPKNGMPLKTGPRILPIVELLICRKKPTSSPPRVAALSPGMLGFMLTSEPQIGRGGLAPWSEVPRPR